MQFSSAFLLLAKLAVSGTNVLHTNILNIMVSNCGSGESSSTIPMEVCIHSTSDKSVA